MYQLKFLPLLVAFLLSILIQSTEAYRILFMGPFPGPSHWLWLEHFQRDLLRRGHHVTSLTNYPTKQRHRNLTEIIIDPPFDIPHYLPKENIFKMQFANDFQNIQMWMNVGLWTTEHALNDAKVKTLIASKDEHFDLMVMEQFFHDSFLMFAHKFKCPIVTIGTMGYADNMDQAMGLLTPWSIVPHMALSNTDRMSFAERAYNAYVSLYDIAWRKWSYLPKMQKMAERHFGPYIEGTLPKVSDLEKNISIMLINSHRSLDPPRPSMPGLISVGGAHMKPAKPLPRDIQAFMDNSTNGVVYFSLGSYVKSTDVPQEKLNLILKALGSLKQNVLWKYENESVKNIPKNMMIKKWLPQSDILAHRNLKVFVTHGGIFGTQEGIYWAAPMLCIPLYGDQYRNSIKSVRAGYARTLNFAQMNSENLQSNIEQLIENPQYKLKALEASRKFRDNPIHPLTEASYWMEYVARHKGAPFLKSYGAYMPLHQYLLLDVLGCLMIGIVSGLWLCIWVLKLVGGGLFKLKDSGDINKNKKVK